MDEFSSEDVIVVVKHDGRFRWFDAPRELWVLDYPKWAQNFRENGFDVPPDDPSERFGIPVVDEHSAERFLTAMQRFEVDKDDLGAELELFFPAAGSTWDVAEIFPILFVDFDRRHACGFYPEGTPMERYIPDGWTGEFEDFLRRYPEGRFPTQEKFWVRNGVDLLAALNERGRWC